MKKHKKITFDESSDENSNKKTFDSNNNKYDFKKALDFKDSTNNDNNFNKAINKNNIFNDKNGKIMFEIQQSNKGDKRFNLNKSFKGDININKVSKNILLRTDDVSSKEKNSIINIKTNKCHKNSIEDNSIEKETNNNLNILSSIIPNTDFLNMNTKKKISSDKIILKRYDPMIGLGLDLIETNNSNDYKLDNQSDNVKVKKLNKGFYNNFDIESINTSKELNNINNTSLNKKTKGDLQKVINYIQDKELKEVKVEINTNFFKQLFKKENVINNNTIDNNNENNENNEIDINTNDTNNIELDLKEDENNEIEVISNKKNKDKINIKNKKNKEKKLLKKKQLKEEKIKLKLKQDQKYKAKLLKHFDKEKVENYIRMQELISTKKYISK